MHARWCGPEACEPHHTLGYAGSTPGFASTLVARCWAHGPPPNYDNRMGGSTLLHLYLSRFPHDMVLLIPILGGDLATAILEHIVIPCGYGCVGNHYAESFGWET